MVDHERRKSRTYHRREVGTGVVCPECGASNGGCVGDLCWNCYQAPKRRERRANETLEERQHRAAVVKKYAQAHREIVKNSIRKWQKKNPTKLLEFAHRRQARNKKAYIAPVDWDAIYDRDQGICQWCREPVERAKMSRDHIWPLSEGGVHAPWNAQTLHRRCNSVKGNRGPGQLRLPI